MSWVYFLLIILHYVGILIGSTKLQAWSLIGMACSLLSTVVYLSYKAVL